MLSFRVILRTMKQNKNLGQSGFSHIVAIIVILLVATIGFAGWRVMSKTQQKSTNQSSQKSPSVSKKSTESEPDISLQNLGLASLDKVNITTNATREFTSNGLKGFYIFGDSLSGGRTNPNFEYSSLKDGTKVISAIDGIVAFIREQPDSKDFEVFIQPKENSMWTIGYDHIVNLAVKKGAPIKAGDVIGDPALQNNGLTRFEIQINKDEGGITTHYCPTVLLATSAKDKAIGELTNMQNSWEKITGLELYDLTAQNPVGCTKKTMTSAEAEGR